MTTRDFGFKSANRDGGSLRWVRSVGRRSGARGLGAPRPRTGPTRERDPRRGRLRRLLPKVFAGRASAHLFAGRTWLVLPPQAMFGRMPAAQHSSADVGSEAGGFRLSAPAGGTLRVTVWGYWTPDVARVFAVDALAAGQKLMPTSTLVVEAAELKPQGPDGQDAWRSLFRGLVALTYVRAVIVGANALTRMQLARLVRESGLDGRMEFGDSYQATPGA